MNEKKETTKILWRMLSYLKPNKRSLSIIVALVIISSFIGILQPLTIKQITDAGLLAVNTSALIFYVSLLALLVILNQCVELLETYIFAKVHNSTYYSIMLESFDKLLHLRKAYYEDKNSSEIIGCLQTDVSKVASITDRHIIISFTFVLKFFSGIVGLMLIDWKLSVFVIAVVPLKYVTVKILSRRQENSMGHLIKESSGYSRWLGDIINGIDDIKLWRLFSKKKADFNIIQHKLLKLELQNAMIGGVNSFIETLLEWSVTILIYFFGGFLVLRNELTIGALIAFITYSGYVTGPVSALLNLKIFFAQILPSAKRLFSFLDMETESDSKTEQFVKPFLSIEFKNVQFQYESNRPVLRKINLAIKPGEKVAIIGKNGAGKSTIINLLLRLYEPDSGEILLNDTAVNSYQLDEYRGLFSVVRQKPYLFFGDIVSNIDLAGDSTVETLEYALNASRLSSFIQSLPDKEKTQIGENGVKLSGGEQQKVALARAFVYDAPIVIFDEASANLDLESNDFLHNLIINEMNSKTILMITHRYSNLKGFDRVYLLENGELHDVSKKALEA